MLLLKPFLQNKKNHLLSLLPRETFQDITPFLKPVQLRFKQAIFEKGVPIEYVYFPCTSVFSILNFMRDGTAVEVGTVGNEGLAGIDILAGGECATDTTICQVEGDSLRMQASEFKVLSTRHPALRQAAQRYLQAYLCQVSQSVACNRLHTTEARFARWVLMTHDRVGTDEFQLTQEFLADMLGVRRPSVSVVAGAFQNAGLISYTRGKLRIVDRQGLEQVCCECYGNVRSSFERLLSSATPETS